MKNKLTIGLIVADDSEYAPIKEFKSVSLETAPCYNRKGHTFEIKRDGKILEFRSILCGIGSVNAATAATYLACEKVDILLNYGFSGGISGVSRNDDVIGTSFVEHDFDLTCLGYKKCEKPGQKYIYFSDKNIIKALCADNHFKTGAMASGDSFVSDPVLRDTLEKEFKVSCCDMETAAIASVADAFNIPFGTVRRVSDDAGENAVADYRESNSTVQATLFESFMNAAKGIFSVHSLWE